MDKYYALTISALNCRNWKVHEFELSVYDLWLKIHYIVPFRFSCGIWNLSLSSIVRNWIKFNGIKNSVCFFDLMWSEQVAVVPKQLEVSKVQVLVRALMAKDSVKERTHKSPRSRQGQEVEINHSAGCRGGFQFTHSHRSLAREWDNIEKEDK